MRKKKPGTQTPQLFEKLTEMFTILTSLAADDRKTKFVETVLRYLTATVEKEKKEQLKDELLKVLKKRGFNYGYNCRGIN